MMNVRNAVASVDNVQEAWLSISKRIGVYVCVSVGSIKLWLLVITVFLLESAGIAMPVQSSQLQIPNYQLDNTDAHSSHFTGAHDASNDHDGTGKLARHDSTSKYSCQTSDADDMSGMAGHHDGCDCQNDRCGCAIVLAVVPSNFHSLRSPPEYASAEIVRTLHINLSPGDGKPPFRPPIS